MTERHLHDDPPTADAGRRRPGRHRGRDARWRGETVPLAEARTLVGLAGSVTTVAAMALDLPAYDCRSASTTRASRPPTSAGSPTGCSP